MNELKSTDDLMRFIGEENFQKIYINTHPERWSEGLIEYIYVWSKDIVLNMGKRSLKKIRR